MKKFFIIFFIGIIFFLQDVKIFALTEEEQLLEWQKVVAEMEKENENEKWIYFFDAIKQKIVKFFNYNDEFDSTSTPKITKDWNTAVYSIWDWIFFKENSDLNFPNNENEEIWNFWEINVNENSVKLFKTEIQWETLVLTWKDEEKFDWYIIQIKDKIDWFLNSDSKSLVYILIKQEEIWWKMQNKFNISNDLKNNENIFLTEKIFSDPELKLFLNENFFYAKIFWIKNWKISTWSAQKILYWNAKISEPIKIEEIETMKFPILVENYLDVADLVFTDIQTWDNFSWDFDWDEIFEKAWQKILLPAQNDLWEFFVNLKITKITWEKFIKKIKLSFFSPKIFFDKQENWKIFWHIEPKIWNFPVYYKYENEEISKISKKILTDSNWNFSFLKQSEKKYREIYLENKEVLWKIFLKTWNVELKFSKNNLNFLVISDKTNAWKEIIAIIYQNWKIQIYDKNYIISQWENWKDFYLKKFGKKYFYINFWIKFD